jgi:hypothetical protein
MRQTVVRVFGAGERIRFSACNIFRVCDPVEIDAERLSLISQRNNA